MHTPEWTMNATSTCMRQWADSLHTEAMRLFIQDKTHGNMLFCFNKEEGLISVNLVPPNIEQDQLNASIINAISEHNLYGIVLIGETWTYSIKENDHTAFQLLDGEMKVSDLNENDKKEALMVRMENSDGDCLIYLDEIIRDEKGVSLKEGRIIGSKQLSWFVFENI